MASGTLRVLSFRTSAGEVVRVHDCICWRHLEGRPCRTAQERQLAQAVDAVIIPVVSSGHRCGSKRARKAPAGALPATGAAPPSAAQNDDLDANGDTGGDAAPGFVDRERLLVCCSAAQAALQSSGLRATVDDCPRQTPGAKYHSWENRGVGLRIEVGSREAASGTFCLALHPSLAHLMPLAAAAAAAAAATPPPPLASTAGGGPDHGPPPGLPARADRGAAGGRAGGGRANLRLGGLVPEQLVAACRAVVAHTRTPPQAQAQAQGQATAGSNSANAAGGAPGGSFAAGADPATAAAAAAAAAAPDVGSQWCRKLHLWPALVEAWGSTESSVATLLAQLTAAVQADGGGGGSGSAASAAVAGNNGVDTAAGCEGGPDAGRGGGVGGRPTGQRPCVAHLRHLLQLGRPCYCGRGHYSLQQLQEEVERSYLASSGASGAGEQQQCQQQQQPAVVEWIALPQPKTRRQQQQQQRQQCQQRQVDKQVVLHGGGRARAATPQAEAAAAAEEEEEEEVDGIDADSDDRSLTDDGDRCGGGDGGGGRMVLLVGNIPSAVRANVVQGELSAAFAPYGCCGVALSRTRNGGSHGWARVALAQSTVEATAAAAAEAVAALDGRLHLGGAQLTVSYSSGRLDTIFPYLPYVVRCAMRVDSTAAFSATDQATADKMTDLLAGLAERLMLPPSPPPTTTTSSTATTMVAAPPPPPSEAAGRASPTPQRPRPLLPLVLTDGTACCGGNALSYARRFERVVAVELDPDRAEDLRHNIALVRAWDDFRRAGSQTAPPSAADAANAAATAAFANGADAANRNSAGGGGSGPREGGLGALEVLCGDYTALMGSLRQDVVFMDPPWGGPQYCGAGGSGSAAAKANGLEEGGGGSSSHHACQRRLLGAEVTLGRSALVVFMLLPNEYGSRSPACAGGALRARSEGDGAVAADAGANAAGAGGKGLTCEEGRGGSLGGAQRMDGTGDEALRPAPDVSEEEDGDDDGDTETGEAEGRESVGGCAVEEGGGHGGGFGARTGSPRRVAAAGSCPACAALGAAFRAALRDCCSRLGLPYRLICD